MADHARHQLREAVATAVTGLTTTGVNVFQSRVHPIDVLPCLAIYVTSETATDATIDLASTERTIEVRIEGFAEQNSNLDDLLDLMAKEVEVALSPALPIASTTTRLTYTGAEITMRDDLSRPCGSVALTYQAVLFTSAPDTIIGA
jgi:hypothetical protein